MNESNNNHETANGTKPVLYAGWVSVKKEFPKHGEWVLACNEFGKMFCVWFSVASNAFIDGVDSFDKTHSYPITHWCPLPPPPCV